MRIVVGSTNKSKIECVENAIVTMKLLNVEVLALEVDSDVSSQPKSALETLQGARNRARLTLNSSPEADIALGIESGIEIVDDIWFQAGYVVALSRNGQESVAGCSRFQISSSTVNALLSNVNNEISTLKNIPKTIGTVSVASNGVIDRTALYEPAVILALSLFYK